MYNVTSMNIINLSISVSHKTKGPANSLLDRLFLVSLDETRSSFTRVHIVPSFSFATTIAAISRYVSRRSRFVLSLQDDPSLFTRLLESVGMRDGRQLIAKRYFCAKAVVRVVRLNAIRARVARTCVRAVCEECSILSHLRNRARRPVDSGVRPEARAIRAKTLLLTSNFSRERFSRATCARR